MKKVRATLKTDVRDLLRRTLVAETSQQVWARFENSLRNLDHDSLVLLRRYFRGSSYRTIAHKAGLSEDECRQWLMRAKRQLSDNLRRQCKVRQ
jgi:DNA-directed RNA polymerase specialized sigma24 family protein